MDAQRIRQPWLAFSLWAAMASFFTGILVPGWFDPALMGLPVKITDLGLYPTGNRIVINALGLIIINSVRSLPLILGAFVLGDRIALLWGKKWPQFVVAPALVICTGAFYGFLLYRQPGSFPYGFKLNGDTLMSLIAMILLQRLAGGRLSLGVKVLLLTEIILGVHCLDVVPGISLYAAGADQMIRRLQSFEMAAGLDTAIGIYAITLFAGFEGSAVVLATLLVLAAKNLKVEQSLHKAQLEAVESRTSQEVLHLVHDLKTPLTTIEGLVSLIQLKAEESKIQEYCAKISEANATMSSMVSEILYGKERIHCQLHEILEYLLAGCRHVPELGPELSQPAYRDFPVIVNRIRLARAVINLIDNAFDAVSAQKNGRVVLRAAIQEENISIGVEDNGPGIMPAELEHVWEAGYSTKGHAGLGLAFVEKVAGEHGGTVRIESSSGQGTTVWIQLASSGF